MNVNGWMPSPAPLLYLGYSPVFSLRFEANHILGPGYTDDKNAPELLKKGLSLHPARNGELWDDVLLHLLADDKGSRHFFGFYSIWKKTLRHSSLFGSSWDISAGEVSGFSVLCWQQMPESCPSWLRVPIFTYLGFCCYGGRCVGETADVFTGFLPRQWCALGACAGGGRSFMCRHCRGAGVESLRDGSVSDVCKTWADLSARIQAAFLLVSRHHC